MSILNRINHYRRRFMRKLTKPVGLSQNSIYSEAIQPEKIKKVLICRPNHRLGNQILITPLVQEVSDAFPNCEIDIFVKGGIASVVFQNYKNVHKIIQLPKQHFKQSFKYLRSWTYIKLEHYDLVINVDRESSSGRLATTLADAKYKLLGDNIDEVRLQYEDHLHIAKRPVYTFRNHLAKLGISREHLPVPGMDLKLSGQEISAGRVILEGLVPSEAKTICLFTYATGIKCYPADWWEEFHQMLKNKFTSYNFIEILPVENVSQINFKEPSFYSKDIREIAAVIANTDVFVGADGGIMHLSSASQTPTIGLFRATNYKKYFPYNKNSLGLDSNETSKEEIVKIIEEILNKN